MFSQLSLFIALPVVTFFFNHALGIMIELASGGGYVQCAFLLQLVVQYLN